MTLLFSIITLLYVVLILSLIYGFDKLPHFALKKEKDTEEGFSIIIPFRNEAHNLPMLLKSLSVLNYDPHLFELLFVDDGSTDASEAIIRSALQSSPLDFKIMKNRRSSKAPKKDAISTAINKAKYSWVITTDADCQVPKNWLRIFNQALKESPTKMLIAPVAYQGNASFLHRFQTLDFYSLQTSTIGGFGIGYPFLCNGANLVYHKQTFLDLHGFQSNDTIASGDDVFLMETILQHYPHGVSYIKSRDAIVTTSPENSWLQLYHQRLRWAAKTSNYSRLFPKLIGLIVLLMNSAIIALIVLSLAGNITPQTLLVFTSIKIVVDFWAIYKTARFFNHTHIMSSYFFCALVYPFFTVLIAVNSLFSKYKWKGRRFKV